MTIKILFGKLFYKLENKIKECKGEYYRTIINGDENTYIAGDNTLIYPQKIYIGKNSFIN